MSYRSTIIRVGSIVSILLITPLLFRHFWHTSLIDSLMSLGQEQLLLLVLVLIILKSIAIAYPPIPGSIITIGSIPFIGWQWAYVADIAGSFLGASVAYMLGKRYGERLMLLVVGKRITQKLLALSIKPGKQIQTAYMLRLATAGVISDGFSWAAAVIGYRYSPFILGYLLSHVTTTLPLFFAIGSSITLASGIFIVPIMAVAGLALYRFKGKYFE